MDPLSSIGVASSLVQLVDFAAKVVSGTYKIHRAISEEKGDSRDIRFITDNLQKLNNDLADSIARSESLSPAADPRDKDIVKLCEECEDVAKELLSVLVKLDAKAGQGVWSSARQALLTLLNQNQLDRLQGRLDTFRQQISMHILVSLRWVSPITARQSEKDTKQFQSSPHFKSTPTQPGEGRNRQRLGRPSRPHEKASGTCEQEQCFAAGYHRSDQRDVLVANHPQRNIASQRRLARAASDS